MLDIRMKLARIDYQSSIEALLPHIVEHCGAKSAPNDLDRLLAGLGKEAVPAALSLLKELDQDQKDSMVVWLIAAHEERLRASANRRLVNLFGGPVVKIGQFGCDDLPGASLTLLASQVEIDYPALLASPVVGEGIDRLGEKSGLLKGAAKMAVRMGSLLPASTLEGQALSLLNSPSLRKQLLSVLQDGVAQAGLRVEVEEVTAEKSGAIPLPQTGSRPAQASASALLLRLSQRAAELRRKG